MDSGERLTQPPAVSAGHGPLAAHRSLAPFEERRRLSRELADGRERGRRADAGGGEVFEEDGLGSRPLRPLLLVEAQEKPAIPDESRAKFEFTLPAGTGTTRLSSPSPDRRRSARTSASDTGVSTAIRRVYLPETRPPPAPCVNQK